MEVIGFVGEAGSGKSTLIERLIVVFRALDLSTSVILRCGPEYEREFGGKQVPRFIGTGATNVVLTSGRSWAQIHRGDDAELALEEHLRRLDDTDLVLVEGYSRSDIPKLLVHCSGARHLPREDQIPNLIALATIFPAKSKKLPWFHVDDVQSIARFILGRLARDAAPANGNGRTP